MTFYIGTSGWHYDHWVGPFYPEDLDKGEMFNYYQDHFDTVEINNSFYRLPSPETFGNWREDSPEDFRYSVKASRYITHMKKLKDPQEPIDNFFENAKELKEKLSVVLFQLPPNWNVNPERLENFLQVLPEKYRYTFEFRDESWFDDRIYQALADRNAAFCIYHISGRLSPKEVTADFVYVRLHGPDGAYQGKYSKQELSGWAGAFSTWSRQDKDIYCYFDNDEAGYAAKNAMELKEMLEE